MNLHFFPKIGANLVFEACGYKYVSAQKGQFAKNQWGILFSPSTGVFALLKWLSTFAAMAFPGFKRWVCVFVNKFKL